MRGRWCVLAAAVLWSTGGVISKSLELDPLDDRVLPGPVCRAGAAAVRSPAELGVPAGADARSGRPSASWSGASSAR